MYYINCLISCLFLSSTIPTVPTEMVALPPERNSRLFLIYNDQCLTSLHHAETVPPHLFHPFSLSSQQSNNFPPPINSSTDPLLHPSLILGLSPWAPGPDEMKTVSNNYFFPFSSVIISPPFPSPFLPHASTINKASQACGKLLTLTNYDTLGGKHIIKPSVCLHKKYSVHNFKRVKVSPSLQNTYLI